LLVLFGILLGGASPAWLVSTVRRSPWRSQWSCGWWPRFWWSWGFSPNIR